VLRPAFATAVFAVVTISCGDSSTSANDGGAQPEPIALYDDAITTIELEIDYASGAEPYTGSVVGMGEVWNVFRTNAEALFAGRDKTFVIPTELAEMEELGDVTGESFTSNEILDLASAHRDRPSDGSTATFYILFLDGFYEDGDGVNEGVLGVSIGDTGVIAMFKPVIESTSSGPFLGVEKFVEQATLVHEFGHAVGLVNNGVPLASAHHDEEHGAHCANQDCVMYFQIEGTQGAIDFVAETVVSDDVILFGSECLEDTAAAP
jgi:predicted Zn-dependent protease